MSSAEVDPAELFRAHQPVFLVGETFTRNIMAQTLGEDPEWRVCVGMAGKWNHGADDVTLLMMSAENAIAIASSLMQAGMAVAYQTEDEAAYEEFESFMAEMEDLLEVVNGDSPPEEAGES